MDVSLKMSASLKGPTLQTWITQKWPNIFMCFFRIWKSGIFVAICSWFHPFLSNCLRMRAFWKKVFKNLFLELGRKMWFSEKRQKLLYFDKALWPNHLTYSKPLQLEDMFQLIGTHCGIFLKFQVLNILSSTNQNLFTSL